MVKTNDCVVKPGVADLQAICSIMITSDDEAAVQHWPRQPYSERKRHHILLEPSSPDPSRVSSNLRRPCPELTTIPSGHRDLFHGISTPLTRAQIVLRLDEPETTARKDVSRPLKEGKQRIQRCHQTSALFYRPPISHEKGASQPLLERLASSISSDSDHDSIDPCQNLTRQPDAERRRHVALLGPFSPVGNLRRQYSEPTLTPSCRRMNELFYRAPTSSARAQIDNVKDSTQAFLKEETSSEKGASRPALQGHQKFARSSADSDHTPADPTRPSQHLTQQQNTGRQRHAIPCEDSNKPTDNPCWQYSEPMLFPSHSGRRMSALFYRPPTPPAHAQIDYVKKQTLLKDASRHLLGGPTQERLNSSMSSDSFGSTDSDPSQYLTRQPDTERQRHRALPESSSPESVRPTGNLRRQYSEPTLVPSGRRMSELFYRAPASPARVQIDNVKDSEQALLKKETTAKKGASRLQLEEQQRIASSLHDCDHESSDSSQQSVDSGPQRHVIPRGPSSPKLPSATENLPNRRHCSEPTPIQSGRRMGDLFYKSVGHPLTTTCHESESGKISTNSLLMEENAARKGASRVTEQRQLMERLQRLCALSSFIDRQIKEQKSL